MVYCNNCGKNVAGERPYDDALHCTLCGRILEDFNFSTAVTFVKNSAGQSQAQGNKVNSAESRMSSSRERRIRIATNEFRYLRDSLGLGDERDDIIDMAVRFFTLAVEQNFTKGRRTELVQCSCLYLTCREKNIPFLLIDFSSYLRVNVYELGYVYLQLCELLYIVENKNYEKLVDPTIFIPRFSNSLLKGTRDQAVEKTARDIIASMKRDWLQTGRKPSGICGAALYTAAISHGIKCSKTDVVKIVHICEATLSKRLVEFGKTEAASLNADELSERERELHKKSLTTKPDSDKERVLCKHKDCKPFGYGLCEDCYKEFITVSGGVVGGSDPPAFKRAEKKRMEKEAREENEGLNRDEQLNPERDQDCSSRVRKRDKWCDDGYDEASDESDNFSDISDAELDDYFRNEDEVRLMKSAWEELNPDYDGDQEAKEAAFEEALNACNANCPEDARKLVEATKAAVKKAKMERQQKRAAETKNAPPPATATEAVRRTLDKKRLHAAINYDLLDELFDTSFKKSKTQTDLEEEISEHENGENRNSDEELSVIF